MASEAGEFWSIGDYATIGEFWSQAGRDVATSLDVEGKDVIDLATGTGVTAIAISQRGARSVLGIDAAPKLLAEAEKRADDLDLNIDWAEADFAAVPRPDGSADLIVSTFGIIFASDPGAVFSECHRLLRPDGQLVFTSWAATGLFGRMIDAFAPFFEGGEAPWHEDADGIHATVGADAQVVERTFPLSAPSAEAFVANLELHSSPFVVAKEKLGDDWVDARAALLDIFEGSGETTSAGYVSEISYLVTTVNRSTLG